MDERPQPDAISPRLGALYVLTTHHRDVWVGRIIAHSGLCRVVYLADARHCHSWTCKGGLSGLAANGPGSNSKIGAPASMILHDVVACMEVSTEAMAAFASAPVDW